MGLFVVQNRIKHVDDRKDKLFFYIIFEKASYDLSNNKISEGNNRYDKMKVTRLEIVE